MARMKRMGAAAGMIIIAWFSVIGCNDGGGAVSATEAENSATSKDASTLSDEQIAEIQTRIEAVEELAAQVGDAIEAAKDDGGSSCSDELTKCQDGTAALKALIATAASANTAARDEATAIAAAAKCSTPLTAALPAVPVAPTDAASVGEACANRTACLESFIALKVYEQQIKGEAELIAMEKARLNEKAACTADAFTEPKEDPCQAGLDSCENDIEGMKERIDTADQIVNACVNAVKASEDLVKPELGSADGDDVCVKKTKCEAFKSNLMRYADDAEKFATKWNEHWMCVDASAAASEAEAVGGTGGVAFDDGICGDGEIVSGFHFWAGDVIDKVEIACSPLASALGQGTPMAIRWSQEHGGGYHGGSGMEIQSDHPLGKNEVYVGFAAKACDFKGKNTAGKEELLNVVGEVILKVAKLDQQGSIIPGSVFDRGKYGQGANRNKCSPEFISSTCPDGSVLTGIAGRSGMLVDAMQAVCRPLSVF